MANKHVTIVNKLRTLISIFSLLSQRSVVTYVGGTAFPSDAKDVWKRWRSGESLLYGPHIKEYEEALSQYHGVASAITFGAGRMALFAILKAMNLREGDEVILPGYTCIVTSNAICYAGLKPVYVDVSLEDFNIRPELVKKAITPKTKVILAQHTFGIPCNMNILMELSHQFGIPVIEDGAHAIGARWRGNVVGGIGYAAFFSTEGSKMLSTERGGYALTNDVDLAKRIREIQEEADFYPLEAEQACLLRWCYRSAFYGEPILNPRVRFIEFFLKRLSCQKIASIFEFDQKNYLDALAGRCSVRYPARLGNLMAYAGLLQLARVEKDIAHRRNLAAYLEEELTKLGAKVAIYDHNLALPSWVRFPFLVQDQTKWITAMKQSGIFSGIRWLNDPIHPKGCDWEKAGYVRGVCPNGEYLANHIMNLPVHSRMSIDRINKFLKLCRKLDLLES